MFFLYTFPIAHLQVGFAELVVNHRILWLERRRLQIGSRRFIESLQPEETQTEIVECPHIIRLVGGRSFKMFCGLFGIASAERLNPFFVSGTVIFWALGEMRIARGEGRLRWQNKGNQNNQAWRDGGKR